MTQLLFQTANTDISSTTKNKCLRLLGLHKVGQRIGDNDEAAEQTEDFSVVVQEIVNRPGFNENSSIVIMIDGVGKRTAKSFDGSDSHAPNLCVTYVTGGCHDSDNDGVCDDEDICDGYDDNQDADNDGIPDGCDDCLNDKHVKGNAKKVLANCGVSYAHKILGEPDDHGAKFFDHGDKMVVKLDDCVDKGQKIVIRLKMRDYNSSFDGPAQLHVYESKHGYCWSYNKTIKTEVKSYYVDKMFTLDGDTKYLKLVNGSTCWQGSPDFYVDAVSYDYTLCDDDVVIEEHDACSRIDSSSDDAEEAPNGNVDLTSSDLELVYDGGSQTVGMRFNNLNIPQGATINNAYIQFTVKNRSDIDPCILTIVGEDSDNAATFTSAIGDISGRDQTSASEIWEPAPWTDDNVGVAGADQQTVNIATIIQEIVNRGGYSASSSIAIIIYGNNGARIASSYDLSNVGPDQAPELCVNYSAPSQNGTPSGMMSNGNAEVEAQATVAGEATDDDPVIQLTNDFSDINIEDAPESIMVAPNTVDLFPVPASRDLNVDLASHVGRTARISVYNQVGQLQEVIELEEVPASVIQLDVSNYQNGAYYMNIEIDNAQPVTKKFLVNRSY